MNYFIIKLALFKNNYESQYADSALVQIQKLEFAQATTTEEYEKFLKKYLSGILSDSVLTIIQRIKSEKIVIESFAKLSSACLTCFFGFFIASTYFSRCS